MWKIHIILTNGKTLDFNNVQSFIYNLERDLIIRYNEIDYITILYPEIYAILISPV